MKRLYCPDCGEYLEGGNGEMRDCHCGFKQPDEKYSDEDQEKSGEGDEE